LPVRLETRDGVGGATKCAALFTSVEKATGCEP
jgi:hypothetical protein